MPVRVLILWQFATAYGWTTSETESAPLEVLDWFPLIERAQGIAAERRRQADSRSSKR
jgi:hypothetical protein